MMGSVNFSALACIMLLAPLVWSSGVFVVRTALRRRKPDQPLSEDQEKFALLVMIAPTMIGALMVVGFAAAPAEMAKLPVLSAGDFALGEVLAAGGAAPVADASVFDGWRLFPLFGFCLYGAGIGAMALRYVSAQFKLRAIVQRAKSISHGEGQSTAITKLPVSPFASACGKIVLPEGLLNALSEEQIDLVIAHERAHLMRRDPVYFSLLAWIDIVFWISPFVRAQTKKCRLAAELACDAAVLQAAPQARKAYGGALLSVLKLSALKNPAGNALHGVPAVLSTRNQGDYRMRITEIMKPSPARRKRPGWMAAILFATFVAPMATLQYALAETATTSSPTFSVRPLEGRLTSSFGKRHDPSSGKKRFHRGADIAASHGAVIVAPAAGRVLSVETVEELVAAGDRKKAYGNLLTIDHGDGYVIRYAQLSGFEVEKGDRVRAGQAIARVGSTGRSTGPHLHVEVFKDGERVDPVGVLDLPKRK